MVMRLLQFTLLFPLAASSSSCAAHVTSAPDSANDANAPDRDALSNAIVDAKAPAEKNSEHGTSFASWLKAHIPESANAKIAGDPVKVTHTISKGDTWPSIAKTYFPVSAAYTEEEFVQTLTKMKVKLEPGTSFEVPHLIKAIPDPKKDRLPWPKDRVMKGVFVTGPYAQIRWIDTLDHMAERGMTAVVLDGKDYEGGVNYPTKAKVAVETGAYKHPFVPDLQRAIRVAHDRGIRVIMRIPCFHDPWAAEHAPRLSIQGTWGKPFPMGWMDPMNMEAREYVLELVKEQIEAGADEIQLDYIRFPVHPGTEKAVLPKGSTGERIKAIKEIVHTVHEVTQAAGVPLSLDLFGVTATGDRRDMEQLGQDIAVLAPECEAISPMVYPSHYSNGYMGFEMPGDHPEIMGIGTKGAIEKLPAGSKTVIRSWLQAFPQRSPSFGSGYIQKAVKSVEGAGGVGWLMWHPGCNYGATWGAFPKIAKKADE